ncbi:MAG: hypothetical protein GAK34_01555 [Delftia tsuruhatensis]|nr:MAG: hypothetical protein GAK34_01555 [Delftia tsuruhatensis]
MPIHATAYLSPFIPGFFQGFEGGYGVYVLAGR